MKKLIIYSTITLGVFATGCLKDHSNVDFDNSGVIAEISHASITANNAPSAGLDYFSAATLPLFTSSDPDTVTFDVNIASDYPPTKDVSVTIAIDDAKRTAYNALGGVQFVAEPDSTFSLPVTTMVIPAGSRLAKFTLIFYPAKIDPTVTYMLPITLTNASGINISGNLSTIYFHIIGNPIAGTYEQYWSRWNATDSSGGAATALYYKDDVGPVTFVPNSPTEVQVTSGGTGDVDIIDFVDNGGVLSSFSVNIPTITGLTSNTSGVLEAADPSTGYYRISFNYINSAGSARTIVNEYIKQ